MQGLRAGIEDVPVQEKWESRARTTAVRSWSVRSTSLFPLNPFQESTGKEGKNEGKVPSGMSFSVCFLRSFLSRLAWRGSDWRFSCQLPLRRKKDHRAFAQSTPFSAGRTLASGGSRSLARC